MYQYSAKVCGGEHVRESQGQEIDSSSPSSGGELCLYHMCRMSNHDLETGEHYVFMTDAISLVSSTIGHCSDVEMIGANE